MAYSFVFWICFVAMFVAGIVQLPIISRLKKEIEREGQVSPSRKASGKSYITELLRLHRSLISKSRTMRFYYVARGAQFLFALAAFVFIIAAQFQPNNMLHLIPVRR